MTDNDLLQEIRSLLNERGVEYNEYSRNNGHAFTIDYCDACGDHLSEIEVYGACICARKKYLTPEQAIAATLWNDEPPYDKLLRCLENDWNIRASWDGLRKFWCIELTEEGVKLRDATHGTLTAEQVMKIASRHQPDYCSDTHVCFDWQAIADDLNERAGRTCEPTEEWCCDHCGADLIECNVGVAAGGGAYELDPPILVNYCPNCGAKVRYE